MNPDEHRFQKFQAPTINLQKNLNRQATNLHGGWRSYQILELGV